MAYWLMKSEPSTFSIDDLIACPKSTHYWDGVRNYQARNWIRDSMQAHDLAFFYHSSCETPGIVGIVEIMTSSYPDPTAFDSHSQYYDPKSTLDNPRWFVVDVKFKKKFKHTLTLQELKQHPFLADMPLMRKGNRLSITPVTEPQWQFILELEKQ